MNGVRFSTTLNSSSLGGNIDIRKVLESKLTYEMLKTNVHICETFILVAALLLLMYSDHMRSCQDQKPLQPDMSKV